MHVESQEGRAVAGAIFQWPSPKVGPGSLELTTKRLQKVRSEFPAWKDDMGSLLWLREMDNHIWEWNTLDVPPGIYRIVQYRRPRTGTDPSTIPQPPLPIKIIVSREAEFRFAAIDQATPGATIIAKAVSGKKIRVVGYQITLTKPGTLKFKAADGTELTGEMPCGTAAVSYLEKGPAFETPPGVGLEIGTTGGAAKGHMTYLEI